MQRSSHKKKLGGYPALGVVTSITLALFVLGLFGNLLIYYIDVVVVLVGLKHKRESPKELSSLPGRGVE